MTRCPRCEAAVILGRSGALSRVTRDGGAEIIICDRCGQREGLYGRDPANQIPITDWPVAVATLLEEEEHLIRSFRASEIAMLPADQIDGPDEQ